MFFSKEDSLDKKTLKKNIFFRSLWQNKQRRKYDGSDSQEMYNTSGKK